MKAKFVVITILLLLISPVAIAQGNQKSVSFQGITGPTLSLNYNADGQSNPVDCFMYFIPLTSPTNVSIEIEPGTCFQAKLTSWNTRQTGDKVSVECDFEVDGTGCYTTRYDPDEMIRQALGNAEKNPKQITKLLDWIRLDSACKGTVEGSGKMVNNKVEMDTIKFTFNREGSKSPVEVCIYDVPRKSGKFEYTNRKNSQVARVNCLKFKRAGDEKPKMSVEIASIKKEQEKENIFSCLTAAIANILSTSTPVARIGNDTMLDFGEALYNKEEAFTFPHAENIKGTQLSKLFVQE